MKIFYAIQATGNGHISRALELLPLLENYGTVDLFLSGMNASLRIPVPVKYRSNGCSLFYNSQGGMDYWKILRNLGLLRILREVRNLPVEKYDLVINDYECITALACGIKGIPSIQFGHQASFQSMATPRPPKKNSVGEFILKNYARSSRYIGFHFQRYDDFIFQPVIRKSIKEAFPVDDGHITVYLASYGMEQSKELFGGIRDFQFEIFTKETRELVEDGNLRFLPVSDASFTRSLISCHGIIAGAGFESPAEALHLGKKLMVIPIRGQYEQLCNAAALQEMGIMMLKTLNEGFAAKFGEWINKPAYAPMDFGNSAEQSIGYLFSMYRELKAEGPQAYSGYPSLKRTTCSFHSPASLKNRQLPG